jgi:hypothetical protein
LGAAVATQHVLEIGVDGVDGMQASCELLDHVLGQKFHMLLSGLLSTLIVNEAEVAFKDAIAQAFAAPQDPRVF